MAAIDIFAAGLICGTFAGGVIGVGVMCLMFVASEADDELGCGDRRRKETDHE